MRWQVDFIQYIKNQHHAWSVRDITIFTVLLLLLFLLCYLLWIEDLLQLSQVAAIMVSFLYLGYVFSITVFTRTPSSVPKYNTELFWSWKDIIKFKDIELLIQNLLNCLLLLPTGLLLPFIMKRPISAITAACVGIIVSIGIEVSQLVGCLGLFEWDDVIHNALGCMIGAIIGSKLRKKFRKFLIRLKKAKLCDTI